MMDHPLPLADLPIKGAGCRIAVYDKASPGKLRRLDQVQDADEHVRRITGFIVDERLGGFADRSEWISVSVQDCLQHGYDNVRANVEKKYGPVHIEAHTYSAPVSRMTDRYERQIARQLDDDRPSALMLCSPGHDACRVRFPATASMGVSVGLLGNDGVLVGGGLGALLKPALLVREGKFPAFNNEGQIVSVTGTSPAVTFVSGVGALLHEKLGGDCSPSQIYAALLLLCSPCKGTYLLERFDVVRQSVFAVPLALEKGRTRTVTLRLHRGSESLCRVAIVADAMSSELLGRGHRFPIAIDARFGDSCASRVDDHRLLLAFDDLPAGKVRDVTLQIDGLAKANSLVATGARVEVLTDVVVPLKAPGDSVVVGVSASHDASAVLAVNGTLVAGIELERITRIKHDGQSSLNRQVAIQYCLEVAGLAPDDVDLFAFNIQALTPGYVGLSQPLASNDFTLFEPLGKNSLFVSHHLCHALAGYSGSGLSEATVVVADGSGGVAVGADDLVMDGEQLQNYLRRGRGTDPLKLHTFSIYEVKPDGYCLKHREYARSFNVRSGSESLGETYAAVSQFVFGSWQASGKLMGLAPYGNTAKYASFLARDEDGELNFTSEWKLSNKLVPSSQSVMDYADLAARIQSDLETAIIDRFERHVGRGGNVIFSGGIALNSVANHRVHREIRPRSFYLLPAQHDAGVAIGAAAAGVQRLHGSLPNRLFDNDFLGYCYTERDVALAINDYAERLKVRRVTASDIALQIAEGAVFGFFSLRKGSEFGPRALGARSILADPRKREVWKFINKWVKYREEFRPFAPMVTLEALTDYFDAVGRYPYMLEIVKVRESFRPLLAGITHVDGSARVQTVCAEEDPEIHALLTAFSNVTGVPILLNTSFNVRGQPMIEQPRQALEMLLSTQLSGVIFGNILVELADWPDQLLENDTLALAPGTLFQFAADENEGRSTLHSRNQGKSLRLDAGAGRLLQAIVAGCRVGQAISHAGPPGEGKHSDTLRRLVRLRILNRLSEEFVQTSL